jgi:4a-hydroxytetrahydrobiopterin dehydratase
MWIETNNQLHKKFEFKDFMTKVALLAEKLNHHPYWTNVYNKVEIFLSTHDAGNVITEKDIKMAEAIDKIANQ